MSISNQSLHDFVWDIGKHRGIRLVNTPVGYLHWCANQENHPYAEIVEAELERRGTPIPRIEISNHAIDRASQHCLTIWQSDRRRAERGAEEGLYGWLHRVALEAIRLGKRDPEDENKINYKGMTFVIVEGSRFPVLKTINRKGRR